MVSYAHISQSMPILAVWVADVPNQMFQIFNRVGAPPSPARSDRYTDLLLCHLSLHDLATEQA